MTELMARTCCLLHGVAPPTHVVGVHWLFDLQAALWTITQQSNA